MDNLRKCNFHKKGIILCYSFAFADSTLGQTSWANRLPSWANWLTQLEQRYQQSPHVRSSQFISSCPKKFINSLHLLPNIQGWHGLIFHSFIHHRSLLDDTLYSLYHFFLSFLLLRYFISLAFFFSKSDRSAFPCSILLLRRGKSPTSSLLHHPYKYPLHYSISFIHSLHSPVRRRSSGSHARHSRRMQGHHVQFRKNQLRSLREAHYRKQIWGLRSLVLWLAQVCR